MKRKCLIQKQTAAALCLSGLLLSIGGCAKPAPEESLGKTPEAVELSGSIESIDFTELRPKIERFCGDCHAVPQPDTFPKNAWYDEVAQGYRFYDESGRTDLAAPPMSSVVAYYRSFAPEKLDLPPVQTTKGPPRLSFTKSQLPMPRDLEEPGVSHLAWAGGELYFCDMRAGDVRRVRSSEETLSEERIAQLHNPAAIHPVDFGDGRRGFVAAELGTFLPADHDLGRVSWLREAEDGKSFEAVVLKDGLSRVADVRPADFDGDGLTDLIVAEFGWRKTGRILLLKQTGQRDGVPEFQQIEVDSRHGTIHVPVVDLNNDGRPDFVALVSQEHEAVDAFLNEGDGRFQRQQIFQADDPSYGSSGIELVDLDADGDLDVLYTNGDSLDSHYLKPYHAVHWLENRGEFPFYHHELTRLPGASRAIAVDLDRDGDLDIACSAYLPPRILDLVPGREIDTLIWLEQQDDGTFLRHALEHSARGHLALAIGDFNADGAPDLAAGDFRSAAEKSWITLWFTTRSERRTSAE